MGETRARLMKGALWIAVGRLMANALGLVSTLILARILVPEDFGLVAISTAFMAILTSITDMPVSEALIQHEDPKDDHFHTAFSISALRGLIIATLLAICANPVAYFYGDPRLQNILWVMALGVFVLSLVNPRLVVFQRELVFHQIFVMQVSEKVLGFIVALTIALVFQNYWALVLGTLAAEVTRVVLSYILRPYSPRLTFLHWRELLSFSIWLTLVNCGQALNWRANPLVYGAVLPTQLMGQYSFGDRITGVLFSQLTQPVRQTLYPAFSRLQSDNEELRRAYLRAQSLVCIFVFPFAAVLIVLTPELIRVAVGEKWLPAVPVIQIQALIAAIQTMVALDPIAMATNNTKRLFYRTFRVLLIRWPIVGIAIWIAWPHGAATILIAAMLGSLVAAVINVAWNMTLIKSIAGVTIQDQVGFVMRPLIAAVCSAAVVLLLSANIPNQSAPLEALAQIFLLSFAGLMAYVVAIRAMWEVAGRPESGEREVGELASKFLGNMSARLTR